MITLLIIQFFHKKKFNVKLGDYQFSNNLVLNKVSITTTLTLFSFQFHNIWFIKHNPNKLLKVKNEHLMKPEYAETR